MFKSGRGLDFYDLVFGVTCGIILVPLALLALGILALLALVVFAALVG